MAWTEHSIDRFIALQLNWFEWNQSITIKVEIDFNNYFLCDFYLNSTLIQIEFLLWMLRTDSELENSFEIF